MVGFSIPCFLTRLYCRGRDNRLTQMAVGWGSPGSPQHITRFLPSWEHPLYPSHATAGGSNLRTLSWLHLAFQNLFLVNGNLGLGGEENPQNDSGSPILYLLLCPAGQETHEHTGLGGGGGEKKGGPSKSGRWLIVAETLAPQGVVWA